MMGGCLLATVTVFALLLCSVPASCAGAGDNVWTDEASSSGNFDRFFPSMKETRSPVEGREEENKVTMTQRRKRTVHSRSFRMGVFSKQVSAELKLLGAASVIAGAVTMVPRLSMFWKCLAEVGPTTALVSGRKTEGRCDQLLEVSRSDAGDAAAPLHKQVLSLTPGAGRVRGSVLSIIVLLAVIGIALAAPPFKHTGKEQAEEVELDDGEDMSSDEEPDNGPLPVLLRSNGSVVVIGRYWKNTNGDDKVTSRHPFIQFPYQGKRYKIFISDVTKHVLQKEKLAREVHELLKTAPKKRRTRGVEKYTWGLEAGQGVGMRGTVHGVPFEVRLPRGTFGILQDNDRLTDPTDRDAWSDFWDELYTLFHILETGSAPPEGSETETYVRIIDADKRKKTSA